MLRAGLAATSPRCAATSSTPACSTAPSGRVLAHRRPGRDRDVEQPGPGRRRHQHPRGGVPPFHVMRVIDAVVARRAAGLPVIDLSAGQPSTPAPAAVRAAAAARRSTTDRIGYTNALGIPPLRAAIAAHYRAPTASTSTAQRRGHDRLVRRRSSTRSSPRSTPATPWRWPGPATRPTATCWPRSAAACSSCRADRDTRFQPTVAQLDALAEPPAGLVLASPANPTGTMVDAGRARRADALVRRARHPADQRRDLPRHHLRPSRRVAPGGRAATRSSSTRSRSTSR